MHAIPLRLIAAAILCSVATPAHPMGTRPAMPVPGAGALPHDPAGGGKPLRPDPLFPLQWVLKNGGQSMYPSQMTRGIDLNVLPVYKQGITGKGVKVMVVDGGVDTRHEDLAANIDRTLLRNFDPRSPDPNDPGIGDDIAITHGTAMAGIVGAVARNGVGGRGVAPGVTLGAARLTYGTEPPSAHDLIEIYGGSAFSREVDIFSSSYALPPAMVSLAEFNADAEVIALTQLPALRGGKGTVVVKPAGNEFLSLLSLPCMAANQAGLTCVNAAFSPERLLPQTIVTASANAKGVRSSFSSSGANILVTGLGGDNAPIGPGALPLGLITTDRSGCEHGVSAHTLPAWLDEDEERTDFETPGRPLFAALNRDCNYLSNSSGTSSAVPTVAGVIALMFEANPALTWRDVRAILARTSRRIDAARATTTIRLSSGESYAAEPAWTRNAAGLWFHNWYGYGLVDATAAVKLAMNWRTHLEGPMKQTGWLGEARLSGQAQAPVDIPVGRAEGGGYAIRVERRGLVEFVQVRVAFSGLELDEVAIELRSPSGTRSVLLTPHTPGFNYPGTVELVLASNAFFSEPMEGDWTLRVVDARTGVPATSAPSSESDRPAQAPRLLGWAMQMMGS